jgi:hypothetical protein
MEALDVDELLASHPGLFTLGTHWIGHWTGLSPSGRCGKGTNLSLTGNRTMPPSP